MGDAISKAFIEGRTYKFKVQRLNLKIGPQSVLMWDFIDKVVARGF